LRGLLGAGRHLGEVVHFGHCQVFEGPTTYTCLLLLQKSPAGQCEVLHVDDLEAWRAEGRASRGTVAASALSAEPWNFVVGERAALIEKLNEMPLRLKDVAHLFVGVQTDADDVYILPVLQEKGKKVLCESSATGKTHWLERDCLKPFLKGSVNIRRYHLANVNKRLLFPYEMTEGKSVLLDPERFRQQWPLTWAYLGENRKRLSQRGGGRLGSAWYGYVYRKNHTRFVGAKLLAPSIATGSCFAADPEGIYYFVGSGGGGGGGYGIRLLEHTTFSDRYLLGVLNSRPVSAYLKSTSSTFRGGYIALNKQYIENVPLPSVDVSNPLELARHDRMVTLVDRISRLHERLAVVKTEHERTLLARHIAAVDRQIDRLVYDLYGLSEDEIRVVEEVTSAAPR